MCYSIKMSHGLECPCVFCAEYNLSGSVPWFILVSDLDCCRIDIVNLARLGLLFRLVQGYLN